MKKNDTGDFSVLYVEPEDERVALFLVIAGEKKPVVLMLAEHVRVFQRPDDFTVLKYLKRQQNLTIIFVIAQGGQMAQMAAKNGFPVFLSMESLIQAVRKGQVARQRTLSRPTMPLGEASAIPAIADITDDPGAQYMQNRYNSQDVLNSRSRRTMPLSQEGEAFQPVYNRASQAGIAPQTPMPDPGSQAFWPAHKSPQTPMPDGPLAPPSMEASRIAQQVAQAAQAARTPTPPFFQDQMIHPPQPYPAASKRAESAASAQASHPMHLPPVRAFRSRRIPLVLLFLSVALIIGVAGSFLLAPHALQPEAASSANIVGRIAYTSSGQVSENSSQGIADKVVADFNNLPDPAPHKSYYVWLLSDKKQSDPRSIGLGPLQVNKGQAHLVYNGDTLHTNLLLITGRVLVTEEDSSVPPISPTLDQTAWRFYGEFSSDPISGPNNPQHYSYLDHLRHLLAADPTLDELELQGGLNNWLYQNTGKVLEWSGSLRGQWEETKDTGFVRRQISRVLEYLDGTTFLYQDLPKDSPLLVNERLARIGLLAVNGPNQEPPSYMAHVDKHLNGLLQASVVTPPVRKQANDLIGAMNNAEFWLTQVRRDGQQLIKMSDDQMRQPSTLTIINDMIENANHAYTGQLDPSTNTTRQGIIWVHDHMQALASLEITKIKPDANGRVPQVVPPGGQQRAFIPYGVKK